MSKESTVWYWMISFFIILTIAIVMEAGRIDDNEDNIVRLETQIHDMAIHGDDMESE